MNTGWLPPLVLLQESGGDWARYVDELYRLFTIDFVESLPRWPGKRVGLKRHPLSQGREATFWHFISEGDKEEDRQIDLRRCETIRWPRSTMDSSSNSGPPRTTASSGGKRNEEVKSVIYCRCLTSATLLLWPTGETTYFHGRNIMLTTCTEGESCRRSMMPTGYVEMAEAASWETASLLLQHMFDELAQNYSLPV